jgi:predicted nucleic acid-binding protein
MNFLRRSLEEHVMSEKVTKTKRFYWDSNVFLSADNANPDRVLIINALLDDCDRGDVEIHTSVLSIAEVAFAESEKRERQLSGEIEAKIQKLWMPPSPIKMEEVSQHVANDAKALMRQAILRGWSLKPMDAIHLATAKRRNVDEFQTYDVERLSKFSQLTGCPIVQPRTDRLPFPAQ